MAILEDFKHWAGPGWLGLPESLALRQAVEEWQHRRIGPSSVPVGLNTSGKPHANHTEMNIF